MFIHLKRQVERQSSVLNGRVFQSHTERTLVSSLSYTSNDVFTDANKQEIAKKIKELEPFPPYSKILNPQHFYHNDVLIRYLQLEPHPVSLRQLAGYGKTLTRQKIIGSSNFVRLELPIRLAMRIRDLQTLPYMVASNLHLAQVYESYYNLFEAIRKIPKIQSLEDNDKFCEILGSLLDAHISNLSHLMMGALEISILKALSGYELDEFMSLMLRSRISRRVIVEQHLSLSDLYRKHPYSRKPADYIGEIFYQCKTADHLRLAADFVKHSMLGLCPDIVKMPDVIVDGDVDARISFIQPHLHYLFGEILRNSYEAVISAHKDKPGKMPPIKVTIINSDRHIQFRISDRGPGIPHNQLSNIWSFRKKPAVARESLACIHRMPGLNLSDRHLEDDIFERSSIDEASQQTTGDFNSTLAHLIKRPHDLKLGLGLPMCKVYADYWNGYLLINSLRGYGTDTLLTLSKLNYYPNKIQLDKV